MCGCLAKEERKKEKKKRRKDLIRIMNYPSFPRINDQGSNNVNTKSICEGEDEGVGARKRSQDPTRPHSCKSALTNPSRDWRVNGEVQLTSLLNHRSGGEERIRRLAILYFEKKKKRKEKKRK